jgi:hypothetical protein
MVELFGKIAKKLEENQISYMLSGSLAMSYYTTSRMTRDIDIVIHLQAADIDKFIAIFENFYLHKPTIIEEVKQQGMFNVIDNNSGFKIDFILMKNTEYSKLAMSRKQSFEDTNGKVWVIAIEDLIIAKLKWIQILFSERQAKDIENLLQNPTVDHDYLQYWIKKLNLNTFQLL